MSALFTLSVLSHCADMANADMFVKMSGWLSAMSAADNFVINFPWMWPKMSPIPLNVKIWSFCQVTLVPGTWYWNHLMVFICSRQARLVLFSSLNFFTLYLQTKFRHTSMNWYQVLKMGNIYHQPLVLTKKLLRCRGHITHLSTQATPKLVQGTFPFDLSTLCFRAFDLLNINTPLWPSQVFYLDTLLIQGSFCLLAGRPPCMTPHECPLPYYRLDSPCP
jgi:hypothetical protein